MRLLLITDLHGALHTISSIARRAGSCDALLLGGDITHFGSPDEAQQIVEAARRFAPQVLAVAGNCDSAAIERRLIECGVSVFGRARRLGDWAVHGVSAMPPWRGTMYELSEQQIAAALEAGALEAADAPRRLVLSHAPPRDTTLDRTREGRHVGSQALRSFIERSRPSLVVCGHIHEARGIETMGTTIVVNCGAAQRGLFAVAELDEQINITLERA